MPDGSGAGKSVTLKISVCAASDFKASGKTMSLAQSSLASNSVVAS